MDGNCICPDGYSGAQCLDYDHCRDLVCENGGTCVADTCLCAPGFEGPTCDIESRVRFIDVYDATEVCGGVSAGYVVRISINPQNNHLITFDNFYNLYGNYGIANSIYAEVTREQFTIPAQNVTNGQPALDVTISGSGEYRSSTGGIQILFSVTDNSNNSTENCSAVYVPQ